MHAPRERDGGLAGLRQRAQHVGVQRAGGRRRQRRLDRHARQLVAEEVGCRRRRRAGPSSGIRRCTAAGGRAAAPRPARPRCAWAPSRPAAPRPGPRRRAARSAPAPGPARPRGTPSAPWRSSSLTNSGLPRVSACRPLAERIAARASWSTAPGDSGSSASRVTRLDGSSPSSRRSGCAADTSSSRQRQHQQARHAVDAAAEELQQVQRGVVGPVHVLEHGHHRTPAVLQRRQHRLEQLRARVAGLQQRRRRRRRRRARCRAAARAGAASRASRRRPTTAPRRRGARRTP